MSVRKILALHQPNFLPWLGFFDKLRLADVFVLLDLAQIPRGKANLATRTHILGRNGPRWLSLPVHRDSESTYRDGTVMDGALGVVWGIVSDYYYYGGAPHFGDHANGLKRLLRLAEGCRLSEANEVLIRWALAEMGADWGHKLLLQSELEVEADKTVLPVLLCMATGADTYLSGQGAASYNDPVVFEMADIELCYQRFEPLPYPQQGRETGEFVPGLSIVDALFNVGGEAVREMLEG
jgi:hypothetical protein